MLSYIPNPLIIPVGLVIGVLVAAPVGPVNIICIQRSIALGMWAGVAAGLGAVLGDGLIALFAGLGVGAISGLIDSYRAVIQIVGGLVLMMFGWRLYLAEPQFIPSAHIRAGARSILDYAWDIPKTFLLTITNPGAVLGLFAIFGGISTFVNVDGPGDAMLMVASIMVGSLCWWVGLSFFVARIRHRLSARNLQQINRVAGLLLVVFGVVLIGEIGLEALGMTFSA